MPQQTHIADDASLATSPVTDLSPVSTLPSGRSVCVTANDQREQIEVRSPQGEVEVRIVMTEDGPVLSLRGARLEIDSTDTVALRCKRFEIEASEGVALQGADVDIRSTGDIHTQSAGQTFIDGDYVNLNCLDRTGYHDEGDTPELESDPTADLPAPDDGSGCCDHHDTVTPPPSP